MGWGGLGCEPQVGGERRRGRQRQQSGGGTGERQQQRTRHAPATAPAARRMAICSSPRPATPAHLLGDLDLALGDEGARDGGAQQVHPLVGGVGAAAGENRSNGKVSANGTRPRRWSQPRLLLAVLRCGRRCRTPMAGHPRRRRSRLAERGAHAAREEPAPHRNMGQTKSRTNSSRRSSM